MSAPNKNNNTKHQWDVNNSFYKWKIYLTNGKEFTGYSKYLDDKEVHNKVSLFCRKMIMLKNYGYFNPDRNDNIGKLRYIEFFRRTNLREYNEKLIYLYPDSCVPCENNNFNTNPVIEKFLKHFYNLIKLGKLHELDYSYVDYSNLEHEEERAFRLEAGRFKDVTALQNYCKQLELNNMFSPGRILHFQQQYSQKYLASSAQMRINLEELQQKFNAKAV